MWPFFLKKTVILNLSLQQEEKVFIDLHKWLVRMEGWEAAYAYTLQNAWATKQTGGYQIKNVKYVIRATLPKLINTLPDDTTWEVSYFET